MNALVYALVALSGASGLMYELVWIRALGLHFGTSTPAIALVTATFMAGLALGNAWLGARADRVARPFALYARMELGIALLGAGVSLALLRAGDVFDALSRAAETAGPFAGLVRAGVLVLLLLAPTTLMGGTLPVLSRALMRESRSGSTVGGLYAWNTLGAVVGVLLPDFAIVPVYGQAAVVLFAAAGNLAVAASALQLARRAGVSQLAVEKPAQVEPSRESGSELTSLAPAIALTTISGFCGMALELLWSRTIGHFTASLATSFAVLLAVYLVMLALGALITRRWVDRHEAPLAAAAGAFALCAIATLATIAFAPEWRAFLRAHWPYAQRDDGLWRAAFAALLHALYLEAVPCLLMGAAFPFVAKALVRADAAGRSTGRLFVVNTLAGVLGSIIAAFAWLPSLGQQDSYLVVVLLLALGGAVAFVPPRRRAAVSLGSAALVLSLAAIVFLPADRLLRACFRTPSRILALHEGAATTAAASARYVFAQPGDLELLTPGVAMSDTSLGARRYMGMMAHAALLAADDAGAPPTPKRALLICYGVGNTARSLLSHPELTRLDVVDISTEVLALAPIFARAQGENPLADPRVRVHVDDGRHHLVVRDERYDVITAEPPPPNHAGVANLYSREFYALAKKRLTSHGVITQWLPVFQLSNADVKAMIAAFEAEFPHTALLYGYSQHFVLIGSTAPLSIDPERALRLAAAPSVRSDFAFSGIGNVSDVYGSVLQTDAELRKRVRGTPPLSDDLPSIQYPWQPLNEARNWAHMFGTNPARALTLLPQGTGTPELRAAIARSAQATGAVTAMLHLGDDGTPNGPVGAYEHGVATALSFRPGDEGLLALLGAGARMAQLAQHFLARPGATQLLALDPAQAAALGRSHEYEILLDARFTLTRRARNTRK